MSALRLARILRIFRAVRIIRIFGVLRHLRLMIFSIISSLGALLWTLLLMFIVIMMSAIYLEEITFNYIQDNKANPDDPILISLKESWGGMYDASYCLLYSVSGGKDWGDCAEPFVKNSVIDGLVYTSIVLFITIGFFNVVVGIFVTETGEIENLDPDLVIQNAKRQKAATETQLHSFFNEIDSNRNGFLSLSELQEALKNDRIYNYLHFFEIDVLPHEVPMFIEMLDTDKDGEVTVEEFTSRCARFQGHVKPMELELLKVKIDKLASMMQEHFGRMTPSTVRPPNKSHF